MITRLVEHARRHVIAYLALACSLLALGGAAYAQFELPPGSVGESQIKNHVITPVKWDQSYNSGFVRHWATISGTGSIISTSPGGESTSTGPGHLVVTWGDAFAGWCAPIATVIGASAQRPPPMMMTTGAYADAEIFPRAGESTLVAIATYSGLGHPAEVPVSVAVTCGPGAGSGERLPAHLP